MQGVYIERSFWRLYASTHSQHSHRLAQVLELHKFQRPNKLHKLKRHHMTVIRIVISFPACHSALHIGAMFNLCPTAVYCELTNDGLWLLDIHLAFYRSKHCMLVNGSHI